MLKKFVRDKQGLKGIDQHCRCSEGEGWLKIEQESCLSSESGRPRILVSDVPFG